MELLPSREGNVALFEEAQHLCGRRVQDLLSHVRQNGAQTILSHAVHALPHSCVLHAMTDWATASKESQDGEFDRHNNLPPSSRG